MKWHWVRLQLRFEAPKDVKLEMLSRRAALSGNTSLLLPHFYSFLLFIFGANYAIMTPQELCKTCGSLVGRSVILFFCFILAQNGKIIAQFLFVEAFY